MSTKKGTNDDGINTGVVIKTRTKTKKPSMYKVLMLNDDYTPMEFVVHVLERFFGKSTEEATRIMLHVHQKGVGVCGVYTFEVSLMDNVGNGRTYRAADLQAAGFPSSATNTAQ